MKKRFWSIALIVASILGLLVLISIVLQPIGRPRSEMARAKAILVNTRAHIDMLYESGDTEVHKGFCEKLSEQNVKRGKNLEVKCFADTDSYVAAVEYKSKSSLEYYCVDSKSGQMTIDRTRYESIGNADSLCM